MGNEDAFAVQNQKSGKWLSKDTKWVEQWQLRELLTDRALAFKLAKTFFDTAVIRVRRKRKVRPATPTDFSACGYGSFEDV